MPTTLFAKKLVDTAQQQFATFKNMDESETPLCKQIQKYWTETGFKFTSCVAIPWSAVFISWCVKQAGATATEFKFAPSHSIFVNNAIANAIKNKGVFKGRKITGYQPKPGDIIQNNRGGNTFDFEFAKNHTDYASHSAIVVEVGEDSNGKYAITIGGNEGDSVREKEIRLDKNGFIIQRKVSPFIAIIENLK